MNDKKREHSAKVSLIERINALFEHDLNALVRGGRRTKMLEMSLSELQALLDRAREVGSEREKVTAVVNAICDSEAQRRRAQDEAWNRIDGGIPASADMYL